MTRCPHLCVVVAVGGRSLQLPYCRACLAFVDVDRRVDAQRNAKRRGNRTVLNFRIGRAR